MKETDDSELEGLQCFPFHLPVTLSPTDKLPSYKSYKEGGGYGLQDCALLGDEAGEPCWGQVDVVDMHIDSPIYACQGHRGNWVYTPETRSTDDTTDD